MSYTEWVWILIGATNCRSRTNVLSYDYMCFLFSDSQPVDFKHLLSMGYQRDWFDEQGQKTKDVRTERKVFKNILLILVSRVAKKENVVTGFLRVIHFSYYSINNNSTIIIIVFFRIPLLNIVHDQIYSCKQGKLMSPSTDRVCNLRTRLMHFKTAQIECV